MAVTRNLVENWGHRLNTVLFTIFHLKTDTDLFQINTQTTQIELLLILWIHFKQTNFIKDVLWMGNV